MILLRRFGIAFVLGIGALAETTPSFGQASYPMLMDLSPLAVQAGTSAERTVSARYNLYGAYQVFISGEGVSAEVVPEPAPKVEPPKAGAKDAKDAKPAEPPKKPEQPKRKVRFTAAAEALTGMREFRLATPQGLSTVGQLIVVLDPVTTETGKNNTQAEANVVSLPAAVCGAIEAAEDVDCYKFSVAAGKSYTFHVRSARCEDKIHDLQTHVDPIISLKNVSGTVLAQSDNYFYGDPLLSHTFKEAGDYFLEVRDVRYQGNPYWQYVVEINDRPFVTGVVPTVVKPGAKTPVRLVGFNLPADAQAELDVPSGVAEGPQWLRPRQGSTTFNPAQAVVSSAAAVLESTADKSTPDKAQDTAAPAIVSGRIAQAGEADCYAFAAKKGDVFNFEVIARRAQSSLDSILAVYNEKGVRLTEADDYQNHRMLTSDSILENWTAPADGKYVVEVRDLHLRGGDAFGYALKLSRGTPHFLLHADLDKVLIPAGVGGQVFVKVLRKNNFTGEIDLRVEGLPKGVRAECGRILADGQDGCICFYAEPGVKPCAAIARIVGSAVYKDPNGKESKLTAVAAPWQETYLPGGGRGHYPVDAFFISVCEPLDVLKVSVSPTDVVLKPGESKKIEITVERAAGFDKNLTLDLIYRHLASPFGNSLPAGVTIDDKQSKTLLTAKETKGHITLVAAKDAKPVDRQIVPVMSQAAINFVMKMSYCGDPLRVTVTK